MDQGTHCKNPSAWAEFSTGMRNSLSLAFAIAPFGLLFGAVAVDGGFSIAEATLMSAAIYAGASQMVGIDLFGQQIAPWMIILSIFAVNFRHVLYSATTGRHIRHFSFLQQAAGFFLLVDTQYALVEQKAESGKPITFAWYMGAGLLIYVSWIIETIIGGFFGNLISNPYALAIDFILPIYFLTMVMGFRKRKNWLPIVVASALSSIAAYKLVGSPWHVSLGAIGGIAVAALLATPKGQEL